MIKSFYFFSLEAILIKIKYPYQCTLVQHNVTNGEGIWQMLFLNAVLTFIVDKED